MIEDEDGDDDDDGDDDEDDDDDDGGAGVDEVVEGEDGCEGGGWVCVGDMVDWGVVGVE